VIYLAFFIFKGNCVHVFDIICAGAALIFVCMGIYRGFVEEVIRLIAVVVAFFTGLSLYRPVAEYIKFLHLSPTLLSTIAFLTVFLACLIAIVLLGILIKKVVHLTVLGWVDRICGGVLGFVMIFFITLIFVITISSLPFEGLKNWFKPAKSYSFFVAISPRLRAEGLVPKTGPVQNILKANPIPAITDAVKNAVSSYDSLSQKSRLVPSNKPVATPKPSRSSGAK
jgi:uncharacterized membrane protein required for colicin V production